MKTFLLLTLLLGLPLARGNDDSIDVSKTLYIDIDEALASTMEAPTLVNNDGLSIELTLKEGSVYETVAPVNLAKAFHLEWEGYTSSDFNIVTLQKEGYNYAFVNEEGIQGYGIYGNKKANPDATSITQRVWLYNEKELKDPWEEATRPVIGYYEKNQWTLTNMVTCVNLYDQKTYYYADIPYTCNTASFYLQATKEGHDYLIVEDYPATFGTFGICYYLPEEGSLSSLYIAGADANMLGKVVEAYLTYGKDPSNGSVASTLTNVFHTFFEKKSASMDDLKRVKIKDYGGEAYKSGQYDPVVPKTYEVSVNEKWNTLCSNAGIDPNTGESRGFSFNFDFSNRGTLAIVIIGGVAVVTIGVAAIYLVYKSRKKARE